MRSGGGIYVSARGGKNIYIINQTSHQKDDQKTNKIDLCEQGGGADDLRRWDVGRLERGEVRDWVKHLLDNNDDKSFLDLWSWKMRAVENQPSIKEVVTIMITTLTKMMLMLVMKEGKEKCRPCNRKVSLQRFQNSKAKNRKHTDRDFVVENHL